MGIIFQALTPAMALAMVVVIIAFVYLLDDVITFRRR